MDVSIVFKYYQLFNVLAICVAVVVTAVTFAVFLQMPQFHKNYVMLMGSLYINAAIFTASRIALAIMDFNCPGEECFEGPLMLNRALMKLEYVRLGSAVFFISISPSLIIERGLATLNWSTYEKSSFSYKSLLLLVIPIGSSIFFVEELDLVMKYYWWMVAISESTFVLFSLFVVLIDHINQKRYTRCVAPGSSFNLSQRFQLAENIRSGKLLRRSLVAYNFGNGISTLMFAAIANSQTFSNKQLFKMIFDASATFSQIAFCLVTLNSSQIWLNIFWGHLRKLKAKIRPTVHHHHRHCDGNRLAYMRSPSITTITHFHLPPTQTPTPIHPNSMTSTGRQMIFHVNEETTVYFENLNRMWNAAPVVK